MKLLIATPLYPPEIGGPATYSKTLENELPKRDIEVRVIQFATVRRFPKVLRHIAYMIKIFIALKDVDVLLVLDPVSVGFPGTLAALLRGKRVVLKVVGDYAWEQGQQRYGVKEGLDEFVKKPSNNFLAQVGFLRMIQQFVARHAQQIIVPSNYLRSIVMTWGVTEEKITVVYNAFDGIPELPSKEDARKELGIHGTLILSAGRLVPWKGFAELIDVVAEIRKTNSVTLFIAGAGPLETTLKRHIDEKNLSQSIILLGTVERKKLMMYLRAADCFVLNTGYEGFSHQLLEVLAIGTPIVTTRVGGNTELIEHEKTGLLVAHGNHADLLTMITRILNEPRESHAMAERGREYVRAFTVMRMVDESIAVFHNVTTK